MRKKMARKLQLAKRVLAFCFALVFACSCLMPALANGVTTYENYGMPVMGGISFGGMDGGFSVGGEDGGVATQDLDGISPQIDVQIGGDLPMPMLGDDGSTTTPTTGGATRVETDAMGNKVYIWDNADEIDVSNPVATMPDADHPMDPGFAIPTNTYRFWLSEMDQFDFENITYDAMAAKMGETEYLKMFGEYKGLFHIMHVADGGWLGHNTFDDPTNADDPLNQNRYFGGWYYYDEIGLEQEFSFDEFVWATAETVTTYDIFARWFTQEELYRSWYKAIMDCSENDVDTLAEYYENYILNDGFVAWAEENLTEAELEALSVKLAKLETLDKYQQVTVDLTTEVTYELKNVDLYYVTYLTDEVENVNEILKNAVEVKTDGTGTVGELVYRTIQKVQYGWNEEYWKTTKNYNRSWLFFVKPKDGYVLIQTSSGGYSPDGKNNIYNLYKNGDTDADGNRVNQSRSYTEVHNNNSYKYADDIVKKASELGYVGVLGYSSKSNWNQQNTYTKSEYENLNIHQKFNIYAEAKKPGMEIEVTSSPNKNIKPDDEVTITAIITPKNVSPTVEGSGYSVDSVMSNLKIDEIVINGVSYTSGWSKPVTNDGGKTYTVTMNYTVQKEDCEKQTIPVSITATATYTANIPAKNTIKTTTTAKDTATTDLTIAPKGYVIYTSTVEEGCIVPESERPLEVTDQAYNPVDNTQYYKGNDVTVKDTQGTGTNANYVGTYNNKSRTYPGKTVKANGGVWTFEGWYYMKDGQKTKAENTNDKKVIMPDDTLEFFGEWSFQKTTTSVTVTKKVTGMMAQREKDFTFTVSFKDAQNRAIDTSEIKYTLKGDTTEYAFPTNGKITLKHEGSVTFTNVPVNATIVVTEDAYDGYETSWNCGVSYSGTGRVATVLIGDATTINFINHCSASPNTGVLLDTLPYLLILAVVAGGAVVLAARKRRHHDD